MSRPRSVNQCTCLFVHSFSDGFHFANAFPSLSDAISYGRYLLGIQLQFSKKASELTFTMLICHLSERYQNDTIGHYPLRALYLTDTYAPLGKKDTTPIIWDIKCVLERYWRSAAAVQAVGGAEWEEWRGQDTGVGALEMG